MKTQMGIAAAVLVCSAIDMAGGGVSQSAAQGAATDVAYVEAVRGRVVASSQGTPTPLDALDIISDQTSSPTANWISVITECAKL
jgi:hypothetical protein